MAHHCYLVLYDANSKAKTKRPEISFMCVIHYGGWDCSEWSSALQAENSDGVGARILHQRGL